MLQQTTVIQWPMSQMFMDRDGFRDNAALCGSDGLYGRYGDSAYAVADSFLERLSLEDPEWFASAIGLQQTFVGPEVDFEQLRAGNSGGDLLVI